MIKKILILKSRELGELESRLNDFTSPFESDQRRDDAPQENGLSS